MPPKVSLNGGSRQQVITLRARLGSLSDNRVSPKTLQRYKAATTKFLGWLDWEERVRPADWEEMESTLREYLECLWCEGESKGVANDTLSGIQHFLHTRRRVPGAWQLLSTWARLEVPSRAPPLPRDLALAMAGLAIHHRRHDYATLVLLAFHCFLRPNEFLAVQSGRVDFSADGQAVLSLPWTKIGQQRGARETIVVQDALVVFWLRKQLRGKAAGAPLLEGKPRGFRQFFSNALAELQATGHGFMPYSLRRGGATHDFNIHQDLQRTLFRGRWSDMRTGRIYICDGAAMLAEINLTGDTRTCVDKAIKLLHAVSRSHGFAF